jgi:hypothetical protein
MTEQAAIRELALTFFRSPLVGSALVREQGTVGDPLPVLHPGGGLASWVVPVTVGDRIAGLFQFTRDHRLLRYASFQRDPGTVDTCPAAASWLDPATVQSRAATIAMNDETLSSPFLTYDTEVTRLAWAVKATRPDGKSRLIWVAGDYVYPGPDPRGGPVTGGRS